MAAYDVLFQPKLVAAGQRPSDGVPDMTQISDLDVNGVNENLRVRFKRDEVYTYTGSILVAVNPYQYLPVYEGSTMKKYQGRKMGELPPHIFATAEAAFLNVQRSDLNQSVVISGESGAGKTETTKFILQYLCASSSTATAWVEQQILECNTILEAFGNARTVRNDNSSRFGKFMQVCFDDQIQIKGMVVQEYLLEQSRITFQAKEERNYHVFYQLVKGGDKQQFLLEPLESYNYLNQSGCSSLKDVDDVKEYEKLRMALTVLSIDDDMQAGIFSLVSAVLQIGNLQFRDVDGESVTLTDKSQRTLANVAKLLQIPEAIIARIVTTRDIIVQGNTTTIPYKLVDALENRHAMAKALYSRTFTWLIDQINQTTNPGENTHKFIGVLDIFGFENFALNSFEQLCINFTNEKLHKFFNHYVFALEQAEYTREQIKFEHIAFTDNSLCLELIEKAPSCVLRLLDEECRFPKGTDQTYLHKQHDALQAHPNYVKGTTRSRWDIEFGIQHFSGTVVYTVEGFLEKNKDVMQDSLFEAMRKSPNRFISDIPKFQNMLDTERRIVMSKKVRSNEPADAPQGTRGRASATDLLRTNKSKPTVGDSFRRQLAALVEVLDETTPWYVRCIKPNADKAPRSYDDDLVVSQLNYSGMLDIVRIRKEGFPVHVPAAVFVEKYHAMAMVMGRKLSSDHNQAAKEILRFIKAPESEWQIGKTKVFLRNTVFEPLEDAIRSLLQKHVIVIQKMYRGYRMRQAYRRKRSALLRIQAAVRGATTRLRFLQERRCAIRIQAWLRGCFAREVVREMSRKKRLEEERKKRDERQRREREEQEREEREKGQAAALAAAKAKQEEQASFEKAQRELYNMAKMAELKAKNLAPSRASKGNLESMLTALAPEEASQQDMASQALEKPVAGTDGEVVQLAGQRTMRRRKRVEKTIAYQEEESHKQEEELNPSDYGMLQFAEKYFCDHPKGSVGSLASRSSSLKKKAFEDPMPKSAMITWTKHHNMAFSLTKLHNPENITLACSFFKDIHKHMKGEPKPDPVLLVQNLVAYCLERTELRDEVFCQLMRQTTNNPKADAQVRGWQLLCCCTIAFPPSKPLYKFLLAYLKTAQLDSVVKEYATFALAAVRTVKINGARQRPPSRVEIEALRKLEPIVCRFYFLDGQAKALSLQPSATFTDVVRHVADKIGLQSVDGWAIFESTPQSEHFIRGQEYLGDVLASWEAAQASSMQVSKYQTISKSGPKEAMGGGDARFVFRKRLFKNPRDIPNDPAEYNLLYHQAVHSVVRIDEFPVNETVALQLAALQSQILFGEADSNNMSRYDEVEKYLPRRVRHSVLRSKQEWMHELYLAHKGVGAGKSEMQAKVLYLTAVKQYPLYGGTFFDVHYKGFWAFPTQIMLSVHVDGFKFVHLTTKTVLAEFSYANLRNVEVNAYEDTVTLNMLPTSPDDIASYMFQCARKEDLAGVIASYSPAHRNFKQVGFVAGPIKHVSEADKAAALTEVQNARLQLAQSGVLLKPLDEKAGFLATTLRRRSSKSKLTSMSADSAFVEFERTFDHRFWSYSKSKANQPLSHMSSEENAHLAVLMFNSLLVFAGLVRDGGLETEDDPQHFTLVQNIISRCLEKEELCNELYLQLVKQTTDQPEPDGRINSRNWQMFSLLAGTVIPRNKLLLNYVTAHLKRCSLEGEGEEGQFARFVIRVLRRIEENKNRKYPPSTQEIMDVSKRAPIHHRFYFMDDEYRALMFDAAATTAEVVQMVKERIGLPHGVSGFSLFEVFGALERNMLPWEKVADAIFKWEKYAKSTHSQKQLRLTFKKRLFLRPAQIPKNLVEFDLLYYQALDDVRSDRFPLSPDESVLLAALRAQDALGDGEVNPAEYTKIITSTLPHHLHQTSVADIAAAHRKLKGTDRETCNRRFLEVTMAWPLYGATIFEVLQSYTSTLPKNLWLAVNEDGIHIMRRRSKEPLITYPYRTIVNYSPSLRNLMIVTESLSRGTKFVFNTSQASQIAHLMKDYTHIIIQRRQEGKSGGAAPTATVATARATATADARDRDSGQYGFG